MKEQKVANNQTAVESKITEMVFILDKSGSMSGLEKDTIGGFNAMIEKQKEEEGKVYVSTVLFSTYSEVLHDRKLLEEIQPLTEKDYLVGGGTALIDAIGGAVKHISDIHKYARPEDVPTQTVFVITTDGYENASRIYSSDKVKQMISEKEKLGWEFLFLGANIDAVETAERLGIRRDMAANYNADIGTEMMFKEVSANLRAYRSEGKMRKGWAEEFEKTQDLKDRKTKK